MLVMFAALTDDENDFMLDLYEEHHGLVRSSICKIIWDEGHLEDLIHDTFVRLTEKNSLLQTLNCRKLTTYVVYTSKSVGINFIKRRDMQSKHAFYGIDNDLAEKATDPREDVEEKVVYTQGMEELWGIVLRLPALQKDLLYLRYFAELNDTEIAELLDMPPATVRQYLTRARRAAKKLFSEEMNTHDK